MAMGPHDSERGRERRTGADGNGNAVPRLALMAEMEKGRGETVTNGGDRRDAGTGERRPRLAGVGHAGGVVPLW